MSENLKFESSVIIHNPQHYNKNELRLALAHLQLQEEKAKLIKMVEDMSEYCDSLKLIDEAETLLRELK